MSELIQQNDNRATIRWKLLTGASALALAAFVSSVAMAKAEDASHPIVWIELGGQLNRLQDGQEIYAPPFVALTPPDFTPPQREERPPLYGIDETAALTFQPEGSSWHFSASIRYGRAGSGKHVRHQSYPTQPYRIYSKFHRVTGTVVHDGLSYRYVSPIAGRFTDALVKESESHTFLDFHAGKDVGLGLFGRDAVSSLNVGIRIAQLSSESRATLEEDPNWYFKAHVQYSVLHLGSRIIQKWVQQVVQPYDDFVGTFHADRSFGGFGPSISWNSSVPFAGNTQDGALVLDWGLNAALLFGRQKTKTHHQTTDWYHHTLVYHHPTDAPDYSSTRSRNVTVPNVGGFAGISWNYDNAKVSFGYRADFFFNAIDGGIDAAKKEDRAFFGPYASISIGLGD